MGPLEAVKPWQTNQLSGVVRFRDRVFRCSKSKISNSPPSDQLLREMHQTIKKVTQDVDRMAFNTAISAMMVFSNTLSGLEEIPRETIETLIRLIAPFAPHMAEEAWENLGNTNKCVSSCAWPVYDEKLCVDTTSVIVIQVNGKVRAKMEVDKVLSEIDVTELAKEQPTISKYIEGKQIRKVVYVPGKILNIVV